MHKSSAIRNGFVFVLCLGLLTAVWGCTQKAENAQAAIEQSEQHATVDAKVDYLVGQANAFLNSDEFNEAIKTAQHILRNLDQDSQTAQGIIEKARAALEQEVGKTAEEMKNKLQGLGQ